MTGTYLSALGESSIDVRYVGGHTFASMNLFSPFAPGTRMDAHSTEV